MVGTKTLPPIRTYSLAGSPPVHVTVRYCDRSMVWMLSRFVQLSGAGALGIESEA